MNKKTLALAVGLALASPALLQAGDDIEARLAAMEQRIGQLERQLQQQHQELASKDRQILQLQDRAESGAHNGGTGGWFERIEFGGLVELEASHHSPYEGRSTSDAVVATVEIGMAAQVNDWASAELALLYEEGATDLEVDVATIDINPPDSAFHLSAGQQYVPFGLYDTNLVSDPLTLSIGETRDTALLAGYRLDPGWYGALYWYNGDNRADYGRDDRMENWGAQLGFEREGESLGYNLVVSYSNDIGDSDSIQDYLADHLGSNDIKRRVPGWSAAAHLQTGPWQLIGEYAAATDSFRPEEMAYRGRGARPEAWNIEAGFGFDLAGLPAMLAVGYQGTAQALALDLPERRWIAALSMDMMEHTSLSFEWSRDDDYSLRDGGSGKDADTLLAKLALEF